MRIGIDIDGVLNNLWLFNLDCGSKYCYENNLEYMPKLRKYEEREMFSWNEYHYREFQRRYYPILYLGTYYIRPFAAEVIRRLRDNHEVYIITARKEKLIEILGLSSGTTIADISTNWLNIAGIEFDQLISTVWDKRTILREHSIDVMLEDSPVFLGLDFTALDTKIICFDTEYNRELPSINVSRAYSWYDVLRLIKRLELK